MNRTRPVWNMLRTVNALSGQACTQKRANRLSGAVAFLLLVTAIAQSGPVAADPNAAESWVLGLRSTGYVYQTEDLAGSSETRYQGFQTFSGSASGLANGRLALRGSGRFANDWELRPSSFETSRLYGGYLEGTFSSKLRARIGRQLIVGGPRYLTLDGAWCGWRPASRWDVNLWAGSRAPYSRAFEMEKFDQESALGGRVAVRWNSRLRGAVSLSRDERRGEIAEQLLALEAAGTPRRGTQTVARVVYDLENEHWNRLQGQLRWRPSAGLSGASFQFVDRRPFIDPASYFYRFTDVKRIRVARGSLRYERDSGFGAEVEAFGSYVDDRSSSRLGAVLLVPGGRVGYSVRLGDTGEENRFYGGYSAQVRPWLRAEGEATFQTYALFTDAPAAAERDLTTLSARLRAQLRPGLRVMAEIQSLDNPQYNRDIRFLCGVDLARGGGSADYGLGQGGWLK